MEVNDFKIMLIDVTFNLKHVWNIYNVLMKNKKERRAVKHVKRLPSVKGITVITKSCDGNQGSG